MRGRRGRGVGGTSPAVAIPCQADQRDVYILGNESNVTLYPLKVGAQAGSLESSLWPQGEGFWRSAGVSNSPCLLRRDPCRVPWAWAVR